MASKTNRTNKIRANKRTKKGKVRKVANRNKGTTKSAAKLFGDK